jgi:hypothetical protein
VATSTTDIAGIVLIVAGLALLCAGMLFRKKPLASEEDPTDEMTDGYAEHRKLSESSEDRLIARRPFPTRMPPAA